MTAKLPMLALFATMTIFALGMLACTENNSARMLVRRSSLRTPANGRRLSNATDDVVMPRQLQDDMQTGGGLGDVVGFFEQNIMLLWLIVLILGCCGCHTVAHYMSVALYGLSYLDLCLGRRPMMGMPGMGGYPMQGGMGGYPMGGMGGGYPMGGMGGGYPTGGMGGGYPMGGMGGQPTNGGNGHHHHHHHHHHASGDGSVHVGNSGYHGGFNAQPVQNVSWGPAGRQPDGSWKF